MHSYPDPIRHRQRLLGQIPWWLPVLILAILFRIVVLASHAISFDSDEAIVGLMARHINQGQPIPVFFYGQPYMGSLDPLLVSFGFRLFGENVQAIRLVQSIVYVGIVVSTLALAQRLTTDLRIAVMAGLSVAVPPVVMTLYTSISLGGYAETLLLGNLLLLVGIDINRADGAFRTSAWRWLALGLLAGLGWWTNSLIVVYVLPVALILLRRARTLPWHLVAMGAAAFLIGSAPWWLYNLGHEWASVHFLLAGFQPSNAGQSISISDKLAGLFLFGLPTVIGIRFPWAMRPWTGLWTIPVVLLDAVLLALSVRSGRFLWLLLAGFFAIFVFSGFGIDATGRYLLPVIVPVAILLAGQIRRLMQRSALFAAVLVSLLGVNLVGNIVALRTVPPGMTPQFDPATDFPNDADQAAIDFLLQHGGAYGYATYWSAYRLIFLSHEAVILSPQLPYKASLVYAETDRYPAYTRAVEESRENPVLVTANLPQLDEAVVRQLERHGITYERQAIGPYTIYYDLSRRINPAALGLQALGPE